MSTLSLLFVSVATLGAAPQGELLEFTATWCGPCQQMSPIVSRLQREGCPIRKVDVDQNHDLASRYRIRSIPAFVLLVHGKEVQRIVGATSRESLEELLAMIPKEEPSPETVPAPRRRASEVPVMTVAENKKKTAFGLPIPFWRQGSGKASGRAVQIESEPAPVVRAKLDESAATAADPAISVQRASTTRIRVKDRGGLNYGSGTIIDSRPGMTIVLTCGHIFRELTDDASVEVNVFRGSEAETYVGKVIDFDLKADVGLIAIATDAAIPCATIAATNTQVARGDNVCSIGCGGGESPSEQVAQVTELNRYTGPDNIECTGVPVQGRSGGGLFNDDGRVIGVCIAADPKEKRGLYAGLKPIHQLLDRAKLARIYRGEGTQEAAAVAGAGDSESGAALAPAEARPADMQLASLDGSEAGTGNGAVPEGRFDASVLPEALKAAGDAEVICIIRPTGDPQAASRVVIINRASSKFIAYLDGELESQPRETMHAVRRPSDVGTTKSAKRPSAGSRARADRRSDSTAEPTAWKPAQPAAMASFATVALNSDSDTGERYRRSPESR